MRIALTRATQNDTADTIRLFVEDGRKQICLDSRTFNGLEFGGGDTAHLGAFLQAQTGFALRSPFPRRANPG